MSITRQTIVASPPAVMLLALALVVGLSAPIMLLPRAHAATAPAHPCAEQYNNGCTELSATPPQDTVAVPPNIVLMLDDSGSMDWDFMPDWGYLKYNTAAEARDPINNTLYYDSTKIYTPPPRADSVPIPPPASSAPYPTPYTDPYPDSPSLANGTKNAWSDGFTSHSQVNVASYQASTAVDVGNQYPYYSSLVSGTTTNPAKPPVAPSCPSGYKASGTTCVVINPNPPTRAASPVCPAGYKNISGTCTDGELTAPPAYYQCPSGYTPTGKLPAPTTCTGPKPPATKSPTCPSGSTLEGTPPMCVFAPTTTTNYIQVFTYVVDPGVGPVGTPPQPSPPASLGPLTYYVALGTATNNCGLIVNTTQQAHCVNADDTSGAAAPNKVKNPDGTYSTALAQDGTPLTAGQNIANWFSYYRTRLLMTKSGLMSAFVTLPSNFRFGFGSINANDVGQIPSTAAAPPYPFDDSMADGKGGSSSNQLAVVQPFGNGDAGCPNLPGASTCHPAVPTQKDYFWTWVANESANGQTPLRLALNAVGQYYTTDQPWSTMTGDPGYPSSTKYACRASNVIMTTDGFWNGDDPVGRTGPVTPPGLLGAAGATGPGTPNTVPGGDTVTQYLANPPYSGPYSNTYGAVAVDASGNPVYSQAVASLADVATYYWETDLRTDLANELPWKDTPDPAAWQHMRTYTIGLGFTPQGIDGQNSSGQAATVSDIFTWAAGKDPPGGAPITGFSWPTAYSNGVYNTTDLAHAALNGHGQFFNVNNPQDLADALNKAFSDIGAEAPITPAASVNASVLSLGALSFTTGYETSYWSGTFQAVTLNSDGTIGAMQWDAGANLDAQFHSAADYSKRNVWTDAYTATATPALSPFQFDVADEAQLDATETAGLGGSATCSAGGDTICNRIAYLLGDTTYDYDKSMYRWRKNGILGAIIRSQPVYVAAASSGYYDNWPSGSPEATTTNTYDQFVADEANRPGMVYVGANDGMLHAFNAPAPTDCTYTISPPGQTCTYDPDPATDPAGNERWAFIPRAVYANLGNLTNPMFQFLPTVDATPVTRDVFFTEGGTGSNEWHTILAGGVGMGGRGVYALDITDPATAFSKSNVLWEFDSDMTIPTTCVAVQGTAGASGTCSASDLGYTVSQPNIGRIGLTNPTSGKPGTWVVLVPNGYFPDCTTPDIPTGTVSACTSMANQAPGYMASAPYSALFVLDAQTGNVIAELKTPTTIDSTPITSFGLATPVMGDYNGGQVDDVAFAGDAMGNLWRFDLSDPSSPKNWTVTLVYRGGTATDPITGATNVIQPITTMPRLFPDPTTNRFMVVFGTGKYLGVGDNSDDTVQTVYGIRDVPGQSYAQTDLTQQYLHETTLTSGPDAGVSVRCVTGGASDTCATPTPVNPVTPPPGGGGWYINLATFTSDGLQQNDKGERVVATAAAVFSSNTAVIGTLITGGLNLDPCDPSTQGSILALDADTGQPSGISSLGGGAVAGARITNALTSGTLPIASAMGGAKGIPPGMNLAPTGKNPFSFDLPMWRRRSWQEIDPNQ